MTGPLPIPLAVCQDCGGAGMRFEERAYLGRQLNPYEWGRNPGWMQSRVVPVSCRSCRRRGRYPATEATGGATG